MGFWTNGKDSVPLDWLGGWRENWASYHIGIKGKITGKTPVPFKNTKDSYAKFLRMDTQGQVTSFKTKFKKALKWK